MAQKYIFVSCGQETEEEKKFGKEIIGLIGKHGMKGFFAEDVHSAGDLNASLFKELQACDGFLAVIQKRGEVHYRSYPVAQRSSVWIQQEIAIIAYRTFLQSRYVPIRVYQETGILLEGVMKTAIVNPIPFAKIEEVLADLATWLTGAEFKEHPVLARRESLFQKRISGLNEQHWFLLELLAAHSINAGDSVDQPTLEQDFSEILEIHDAQESKSVFIQTWKQLLRNGLIDRITDPQIRGERLGISKKWWDLVNEKLRVAGRKT